MAGPQHNVLGGQYLPHYLVDAVAVYDFNSIARRGGQPKGVTQSPAVVGRCGYATNRHRGRLSDDRPFGIQAARPGSNSLQGHEVGRPATSRSIGQGELLGYEVSNLQCPGRRSPKSRSPLQNSSQTSETCIRHNDSPLSYSPFRESRFD